MGPGVKKKFEVDEENPAESITKAFGMFMTDSNTNVLLLSGAAGSGKSTAYAKLQTWILTTYTKMRKDKHDIDVVLLPVALSQLKNPINGIFKVEVQQICLIPNSCSARLGVCIPTLHAHCTYTRRGLSSHTTGTCGQITRTSFATICMIQRKRSKSCSSLTLMTNCPLRHCGRTFGAPTTFSSSECAPTGMTNLKNMPGVQRRKNRRQNLQINKRISPPLVFQKF